MRYPTNEVTPHGWYSIIKGDEPMMWLDAYDDSMRIDMLGGLAHADPYDAPESVRIPKDGLTGLIPPWKHIDQKGATQDGVTQVDALYEPTEISLKALCRGRDPQHTRRVSRDVIACIDAHKQSKLNFLTHDMGHWWAPVRWFKGAPSDPLSSSATSQLWSLRLRGDNAFWRTYDNTDSFSLSFESMVDDFDTDYSDDDDLGPNWPQYYTGTGGYCSTTTAASGHKQARWYESGSADRAVVNGPYKDFSTATDNQVVEIQIGSLPELTFQGSAYNDIWGRMGRDEDGDWDGNGIRARIGLNGLLGWVELSRWNGFTKTILYQRIMFVPPARGEYFTLVCGADDSPRTFKLLRNGITVITHKESGTGSALGADFRGVGFGLFAGGDPGIPFIIAAHQKTPAWVAKISAGDNGNVSQEGFLVRTNEGDQPMYDDYTLFGPGLFKIYDGPGSDEYVSLGPLLVNQVVFMRTDPRVNTTLIQDLTEIPPTPQQLNIWQQAMNQFLNAVGLHHSALADQIKSQFGIRPPQGNLYKYLKGRFSSNAAIPPKSPGNPVQSYHVKVAIDNGNADSKIICSGVPLRRYPL